jgi:hypothetical protein
MKPERKAYWDRIRKAALSLGLPRVSESSTWGEPALKAHGKLWVWWSPNEDAPVFKVTFEEREILVEVDPETFFYTPHYKNFPMVLVRPEKLKIDWVKKNMLDVWRAQAPKRFLKEFDFARTPGRPDRGD